MKDCDYDKHVKSLNNITKKLSDALGDFDYLQCQISEEIEALSELRGEICERAEKVAQSLDLNRKESKPNENNQTQDQQHTESKSD